MPGVHAVLTHDDVPGEKTLRARVPRPAGARDRPRPLLRRAGRARRGRASRAGAPRRRAGPRRVRAARAGRRHGARDRAAADLHPEQPDRAATATATTRARTSSAHDRDPPRRPRRGGRRQRSSGVYELGIQDQAFLGPESGLAVPDGEGGVDIYVATQWLHVDRDQVAPCLGLAARAGAHPPRRRRRRVRRARGPLDADPRRAARAAHEPAGEDRLQPRGVVHRPRPPPPGADLVPSTARRATGKLVNVRMRILLDGGAYASSSTAVCSNAAVVRGRAVRGRRTR